MFWEIFLLVLIFLPHLLPQKNLLFWASLLMLGDSSNRHKSENFDTFWHLFENANLKQPLTFLEKFMRTLFWQLASPAYNSLMLLDVRSTAHFKVMSIRILTVMKFSNSCTDATGLLNSILRKAFLSKLSIQHISNSNRQLLHLKLTANTSRRREIKDCNFTSRRIKNHM